MPTGAAATRVLRQVVAAAPAGAPARLAALSLMTSLTEGLGLVLLVPLLAALGGTGASANPVVAGVVWLLAVLGLALTLESLLIVFVGLIALRAALMHARERVGTDLQNQVVDGLRHRCFAALLAARWRWMVATRKSDHAQMLLGDVGRVGTGLHFGVALTGTLAASLATVAVALLLSWKMTLVALSAGAAVFALLGAQRRSALQLGQTFGLANRALQSRVQESLAGIRLTKILGAQGRHLAEFERTTRSLRDQQWRFMVVNSWARSAFMVGGAVLLAAFLIVGSRVIGVPMAELMVLALLFARTIPLFMAAHQQLHGTLHALPAFEELDRLLTECEAHAEPRDAQTGGPAEGTHGATRPLLRAVTMEAVTVRYEGRPVSALDRVSLSLPAFTTTAIMGPSGSGKSTLADVLAGLLEPDEGRLSVDGRVLDAAGRMAWRRSIAYVPQDVFLFHESIRANLLWVRSTATEAELVSALKMAAAEFVLNLPKGLDTVVGDGGVMLSGGERQRIALARALLQRPSLLILDEATSALDVDSELRIRHSLDGLKGQLTIVVVGHRLPTLEGADQVVVLEGGRVARLGTWAQVEAGPAA